MVLNIHPAISYFLFSLIPKACLKVPLSSNQYNIYHHRRLFIQISELLGLLSW